MSSSQQLSLQPIAEEAGQLSFYQNSTQGTTVAINNNPIFANTSGLQYASTTTTAGCFLTSSASSSSSSLSPSSIQINQQAQQQYQMAPSNQMFSPPTTIYVSSGQQHQQFNQSSFSIGSVSSIGSSQSNLEFEDDHADSYQDSNSDRLSHMSIKERRQSLNRKLAQRPQKKDLVDLGILPSSRVPPLHYDQARHLEKAQIHDILKTKIERRPKRELLVQKNILPDSKAAPSLQLKCNELKRARLADDLNEKLAKRPGPLELVESGILVSSDRKFTDAIKDGKIAYPRTSSSFFHHEKQFNPPDEAFLSNFNFNFSLTDNDESNASSQASTSTNQTNSSSVTSFSSSSLTFSQPSGNNYAGLFQGQASTPSNVPSPASSISTNATLSNKFSSSSSPSSNAVAGSSSWDFVRSGPITSTTSSAHHRASKPKAFKSFSSASSTSSKAGQNGPSKKVSQLIMHEYNGPNQKSSKSVLSLTGHAKSSSGKSSKRDQKTASNSTVTNQASISDPLSNANSAANNATSSNSANQMGLAEFLFDGSNDSSPLNLPNEDNDSNEPLDPYEIRLKQQQMFLEHDRTPTNQELAQSFIIQSDQAQSQGNHVVISFSDMPNTNQNQENDSRDSNSSGIMSGQLEINLNEFMSLPDSADILSPDFENTLLGIDIGTVNGGHLVMRAESLQEVMLNSSTTARFEEIPRGKGTDVFSLQPQTGTQEQVQAIIEPIKENASAFSLSRPTTNEKQLSSNQKLSSSISQMEKISEMNITELKDECRRLKVKVTGNKTTLIDRLKTYYSQQLINVNADLPPIANGEGTPKNIVTSQEPSLSINQTVDSMAGYSEPQQQQQQQQQQTIYEFQINEPCSFNGVGAIQLSGSLRDHPNLNDLISAPSSSRSAIFDTSSRQAANEHELKLNTFKTNLSNDQLKAPIPQTETETGNLQSKLQLQFENSSELLKKCSSADELKMEDIQRLEKQVQESMKIIEHLKSSKSSATLSQQSLQHVQQNPMFHVSNTMRQISSLPSNLKEMNGENPANDQSFVAAQPQHAFGLTQNFQIEVLNEGLGLEPSKFNQSSGDQFQQLNGNDRNGFMCIDSIYGVESTNMNQIPVNRVSMEVISSASVKNASSLPSIYAIIGNDGRATDNMASIDQNMIQPPPAPTEFDLNELDFLELGLTTAPTGVESMDNTPSNSTHMQIMCSNVYQPAHQQSPSEQSTSYLMNNLIPLNNIKHLQQQAAMILKNNVRQAYLNEPTPSYVYKDSAQRPRDALISQQELNGKYEALTNMCLKNSGGNSNEGHPILIKGYKNNANSCKANKSLIDEQYIQLSPDSVP